MEKVEKGDVELKEKGEETPTENERKLKYRDEVAYLLGAVVEVNQINYYSAIDIKKKKKKKNKTKTRATKPF